MKVKEQYNIVRNPEILEETKIPQMPLLLVFKNGFIIETRTIRAAVAAFIGLEYFDCEDAIDEWNLRVVAARKEAMKATMDDKEASVFDSRYGVIPENFAEAVEQDYEIDQSNPPSKIQIQNEKSFLLSLAYLGSVEIYEREDARIITTINSNRCCLNCTYRKDKCEVYNCKVKDNEGKMCTSFVENEVNIIDKVGKEYVNVLETNIPEIIENIK